MLYAIVEALLSPRRAGLEGAIALVWLALIAA
jgi:hypothetical protein